jgi:co-chaperonin GroES (HSP10)
MTRRALGNPHEVIDRLRDELPKPFEYDHIEPKAHGPTSRTLDEVRLLRGRVLVRPLSERTSGVVWLPPPPKADGKSVGYGVVVAIGAPALNKRGREVMPGFVVGDRVLHVGQHRSRDVEMGGETFRSIAQAEVQAVVEEGEITDTHSDYVDPDLLAERHLR